MSRRTIEDSVIKITSLSGLCKAISTLQNRLYKLKEGGEIRFYGSADIGVRQEDHSDIASLSTCFKGNIILETSGRNPERAGFIPCVYDYTIHNAENPSVESRFSYWVSSINLPVWQRDKFYPNAIKLSKRIQPNLAYVLLLQVEPKK